MASTRTTGLPPRSRRSARGLTSSCGLLGPRRLTPYRRPRGAPGTTVSIRPSPKPSGCCKTCEPTAKRRLSAYAYGWAKNGWPLLVCCRRGVASATVGGFFLVQPLPARFISPPVAGGRHPLCARRKPGPGRSSLQGNRGVCRRAAPATPTPCAPAWLLEQRRVLGRACPGCSKSSPVI